MATTKKPPKIPVPTIRVSWSYNKNQEWVGNVIWVTTNATSLTINGMSVQLNGRWKQFNRSGKALHFSVRGPGGSASYIFRGVK